MTVREIYRTALALLFETEASAPDYGEEAPVILNVLLPEVLGVNNQVRAWKGLGPLKDCPVVTSLEQEVPLEPELCRAALPYGLAANLLLGDEEEARSVNYFAKYAEAVNQAVRLCPEKIRDVYSGEGRWGG